MPSLMIDPILEILAEPHRLRQGLHVFVLPSEAAREGVESAFRALLGRQKAEELLLGFPHFVQAGAYRFESARRLIGARLNSLSRLQSMPGGVFVTSLPALARFVPSLEWLKMKTLSVSVGMDLEQEDLVSFLEASGYLSGVAVDEVGDYAVRGGIVDVWVPGDRNPLRIECFGDEVESLRSFRTSDQRSFEERESTRIIPCREFHWPKGDELERCLESLNALSLGQGLSGRVRADLFENIRQGVPFAGLDDAAAELFPLRYCSGLEWLASWGELHSARINLVVVGDRSTFQSELQQIRGLYDKAQNAASQKGFLQAGFQQVFTGFRKDLFSAPQTQDVSDWLSPMLAHELPEGRVNLRFHTQDHVFLPPQDLQKELLGPDIRKARDRIELMKHLQSSGKVSGIIVGVRSEATLPDLLGMLSASYRELDIGTTEEDADLGLPRTFFESLQPESPRPALPLFCVADLHLEPLHHPVSRKLFVSESWLLGSVTTQSETFLEAEQVGAAAGKSKLGENSRTNAEILLQSQFGDFAEGDLVVHVQHGVARFLGLATVKIGETSGDFLALEYAGQDKIYVPVDKLNLVQKYVGAQTRDNSMLDNLKSQAWEKKRERAKKDAEKVAQELLEHQARRETTPGHAYGAYAEERLAFAAAFPFDETPDQLKACREIAADMMSENAMDRLLCGDVGFGKTEVAMRAAYHAVLDGKQVAWLVPTTVLAHQHRRSLMERFADFGVQIGLLDRSGGSSTQRKTLEDLRTGKLDLIIGTHRLLSADVQFQSLGLLIVDEEQRFGVLQKEKIKNLSYGVDVLTMSATPIPRTLQMAMLGLRDLSLLTTPPRARLAVKTFVSPFDEDIIKDAIKAELSRSGQCFFVHNRVEDLETLKGFLSDLVPGLRIGVGHGKLSQKELDDVVIAFLDGQTDLLLCTTIIESGIDMPNVNTIIVQDADRFGLAQLYQLRGRVGRRSSRGYAYFMLSPGSHENDEGFKRVEILKEHQSLGSGFVVATHDLELRGAGNIVGDDQSGRVSDVGLETYTQMLNEAVKRIGGVPVVENRDVDLKIPVDVKIPESYIESARERLRTYRRFFSTGTEESLQGLLDECEDRFGKLPTGVKLLGEMARVKRLALRLNATSLVVSEKLCEIRLSPDILQGDSEHAPLISRILDVCNRRVQSVRLTPDGRILNTAITSRDFRGSGFEKAFQELRFFLSAFLDGHHSQLG